jgi:hypothetical protein
MVGKPAKKRLPDLCAGLTGRPLPIRGEFLLTDLAGRRRRWCAFRIRCSPAKGAWGGLGATPADRLHLQSSRPILAGMAKKPEPAPKPTTTCCPCRSSETGPRKTNDQPHALRTQPQRYSRAASALWRRPTEAPPIRKRTWRLAGNELAICAARGRTSTPTCGRRLRRSLANIAPGGCRLFA